ncbi:NAD-dependent epimerase/dehydratase family protein [Clostridium sp. YIM B02555]|uniref:NAD-dependent epimerase/dehydratase family protein n=1 Tax=Clostridium sp. YIM B02555 TaxID=2911968 RepID=UPI001EED8930|nr:NAD-dependent epimerase/dehydratase family protein [Clostridium sp. YIM B02555]
MNCLVLGGTGFIGTNLCQRLIKEGHKIKVFARNNFDNSIINFKNIEFIQSEFNEYVDFEKCLDSIDMVFHLISTTVPSTSNEDRVFDLYSNVIPTLKLLDACVKKNIKKIVFLSSGGTVYGIPKEIPINEEHPTNPICSYAIQKLTIEKYLHFYFCQFGLDYSIIRLSNPYGIGQVGNRGQGVVPIFMNHIMKNEPITIWGDGSVTRDYIYIDDVSDAITRIMNYSGETRLFNIGSGYGLTLIDVANKIAEVIGRSCEIKFLEARKIDVNTNVLNIDKAMKELEWKPLITFDEGISKFYDYIKVNEEI